MDWWQALREYRAETQRFAREHGIRLPLRRLVKWYPAWRRHRPEVANPLSDRKPWINFLGFRHLKRILRPDMRMFEYGAGGSTLFFAQRVRSLVSVEHDPQWLAKTEAAMKGIGASNWEAILEPPTAHQEPSNPDPADPNSYVSSDRRYEGLSFRRYVSSIDRFEPNHFDLIFLDGRARPSCLKHALGRLKIGGYLILDNADVGHYARVVEAIQRAGWPGKIHYSPGPYGYRFWATAIWSKPSGEMVLNPYLSLPNWEYQKTIIEPHLTPDSVVLDVGCGNNPAPPATVLADYFPDTLTHRAGALAEDRPVVVCNVERLPFQEGAFDFVICSHVLEHVESPHRGMREMARVARAGYSETPAYGKDVLVGTGDMHRWQVVEFEGIMHFFEYNQRQHEAHTRQTPFMHAWQAAHFDPLQPFFWQRQDVFNAQLLWKSAPPVIEYRRAGGTAAPLPAWRPVSAELLLAASPALSATEIALLEARLASPDGKEPMRYRDGVFTNVPRTVQYPVRGKRVYCEIAA